jgi:diaminopimelate epimerase
MNFTKMQAAGNDFVVVEAGKAQRHWPEIAKAMCERHFGIGANGLLLVLPSVNADFRMRIFNPDGSEAEACGNGLRCLVRYVVDKGLTKARVPNMLVETMSGTRKINLYYDGSQITRIQVGMGEPELRAEKIPVLVEKRRGDLLDIKPILDYHVTIDGEDLPLSFVSMGNPHAVCFCPYPVSDFPLSRLGPKVEQHQIFPNRVNFEVARIASREYIEARVWERGAGETLACGSGACAIAVAARLHGYIDDKVTVRLPGGTLEVEWDGAGQVLLSGPTQIVFTGDWPE